MKKLSELAWDVPENVYREDKALSYSNISRFDREGFNALATLFDKISSPSLTFGSLVDTLLTETEEVFKQTYAVVNIPSVTDQVQNVLEEIFRVTQEEDLNKVDDAIIHSCCKKCNYYIDDKWANKRKKEVLAGAGYYRIIAVYKDKKVISPDLYKKALDCKKALIGNPNTAKYFLPDVFGDYENYYQLKFKGSYKSVNLRCMVDCLHVDHKAKTITPIDLKTTSKPEYNFPQSFITYRYAIQAQLYWTLIRAVLNRDEEYKDYELLDYKFIVVNKETLNPLVWEFNQTQRTDGYTLGNETFRGWREIVVELNDYLTLNKHQPDWVKPINIIEDYFKKE